MGCIMNSPDSTILEQKDIMDRVFAPGNLIWGTTLYRNNEREFANIVTDGIKRAKESDRKEWGLTPGCICLSMLSTAEPDRNYLHAVHSGPKTASDTDKVGIVINRQKLLHKYPGQMKAVGNFFFSQNPGVLEYFPRDDRTNTIYSIPIEGLYDEVWNDEVRLYEKTASGAQGKIPIITPDTWEAIVATKEFFSQFASVHLPSNLFLFSEERELIGRT